MGIQENRLANRKKHSIIMNMTLHVISALLQFSEPYSVQKRLAKLMGISDTPKTQEEIKLNCVISKKKRSFLTTTFLLLLLD